MKINIDITVDEFIWGDKFKNIPHSVYVKIDDAYEFIRASNKKIHKIISHNGDYSVDERIMMHSNKFSFWFGQNVTVDCKNIFPIPIGLENDYVANAIDKKKNLYKHMQYEKSYSQLLYINHNIGTNHKERILPYQIFANKNFATLDTCVGFNGQENYYSQIKNHFFTLSPPGNGIDCHRTWEILYLGRCPILRNVGQLKKIYQDLPVVFVDTYEEITEDFLSNKKSEIENRIYNYNKLKFSYWYKYITDM